MLNYIRSSKNMYEVTDSAEQNVEKKLSQGR